VGNFSDKQPEDQEIIIGSLVFAVPIYWLQLQSVDRSFCSVLRLGQENALGATPVSNQMGQEIIIGSRRNFDWETSWVTCLRSLSIGFATN